MLYFQIHQSFSLGKDNDNLNYNYNELERLKSKNINITEIYKNKENYLSYKYDEDNQLIESNNYQNNKKYKYTYDNSGNILKKEIYNLQINNYSKETLMNIII